MQPRIGLISNAAQPMAARTDLIALQKNAPFKLQGITQSSHFYANQIAQNIRDNAGIKNGEIAGLQNSITAGLEDNSILITQADIIITNETDAQNNASSGTGTQSDPYIIRDKDFNGNSNNAQGLHFNITSGSFYIAFINCLFRNHTNRCVWLDETDSCTIILQQCEFYNSVANAELIYHQHGQLIMNNCKFSGCNSYAGYLATSTGAGTSTIRNLYIDASQNAWKGSSDIFYLNNENIQYDINYIETQTDMSGTTESVFQVLKCADHSIFSGLKLNGGFDNGFNDSNDTPIQKTLTITNFDIRNTRQEAIQLQALNNSVISYGIAQHNDTGSGYRLVYLNSSKTNQDSRIENTRVTNLHLTKKTGSGSSSECLQTARAKNVTFAGCYVTECTEDAFEHIEIISGCTIEYCVADNCTGQIADFYKMWDESTWTATTDTSTAINSECYAHHIYGDCADHPLICTGLNGLYFHDIIADNTSSTTLPTIRLEDANGLVVRNIFGAGPITPHNLRGNGSTTNAAIISGGSNIEINYYDSDRCYNAAVQVTD